MVLETGIEPIQDHPRQQQRRAAGREGAPAPESTLDVETSGDTLFDSVYQTMESFAATRIGQYVIEQGDRLLRTVEETAKWSLPNEKSETALQRPLPWLPFLALIITLRQLRFWVSIGALLIGNGPVTAQSLVYFLQTRRRKLRSIRLHGVKIMRQRELERNALQSGAQDAGFMVKLGKLLTIAMCRPGYLSEPAHRITTASSDEPRPERRMPPRYTQKRQREDDTPEADLTCSEMLSKYANENSDDDSDYMPNCDEETNDESTSVASSNDSQPESKLHADNENAKEVSSKKPKDTRNGAAEQSAAEADMNTAGKGAQHADAPPKAADTENATAAPPPQQQQQQQPQPPQPPLENGPSNGGENREADVVQTRISKTISEQFRMKNVPNGHNTEVENLTKPELESAAAVAATLTRPQLSPPLLFGNNVTNTTTDNVDVDAADDASNIAPTIPQTVYTNTNISTNSNSNNNNQTNTPTPFNVPPSPPCSTASSSSSLASFVTSDDFVVGAQFPDAPTPTPSLDSSYHESGNAALNTASSSEDVFHSPIGSPPNFNAFYKSTNRPINQSNPAVRFSPADGHSTPKTTTPQQPQQQQPPTADVEIASTSQKSKQLKTQPPAGAYEHKQTSLKHHRNRRYRR